MSHKGSGLFRDLADEEEHEFRAYAQHNDPEDLGKWDLYHPVCRQEWERRGIYPKLSKDYAKMAQEFKFSGTVSHGTHRTEDLIPAFEGTVRSLNPSWFHEDDLPNKGYTEDEDYLDSLFNELERLAPAGYYFGAHPGDGSDFGFWQIEEE